MKHSDAVALGRCASGRGWSGDCENGEVVDGDLVISKLVVEVDSRFGEYQLGMGVRYSKQVFRSDEMRAEAMAEATTAEFEERIAQRMQSEGVPSRSM